MTVAGNQGGLDQHFASYRVPLKPGVAQNRCCSGTVFLENYTAYAAFQKGPGAYRCDISVDFHKRTRQVNDSPKMHFFEHDLSISLRFFVLSAFDHPEFSSPRQTNPSICSLNHPCKALDPLSLSL